MTRTTSIRRSRRIALLLLVTAAGCGGTTDEAAWRLNGRIEAPLVDLAPRVSGRVTRVLVREGDRVKAGDVLVQLDLGETALGVERETHAVDAAEARVRDLSAGSRSAEIRAAEAGLAEREAAAALATREVERQTLLRERRVGTARDLDRATTEQTRADAAVAAARQQVTLLRDGARQWQVAQARAERDRIATLAAQAGIVAAEAEIRAPADGVILHRLVETGALVGPGQPALTLGLAARLYVRTFIPEPRLGQVRQGQAVWVQVDAYPGRRFPARVTEISPTAEFTPKAVETRNERVNLVYAAEVDLDAGWDAPLVPGQPAEVTPHEQTPREPAEGSPR